MPKYIIKFNKNEKVKYVSHLDIVRMFGRTMRRAEINLSCSQGFNPHPLMSFAHPLGVGISSSCELMEISIEDNISAKDLALRTNAHLPGGFSVAAVKKTAEKSPFAKLAYARYLISIKGGNFEKTGSFMSMSEIIMEKRTKSGTRETDIKPFIGTIETEIKGSNILNIKAVIKCGAENLKPELLLGAFEKYCGVTANDFIIHRSGLLNSSLTDLIQFG